MSKRRLIFTGAVFILGVLLIVAILNHRKKHDPGSGSFEEILWAPCAKFESRDVEDGIYITSEIRTISVSFASLDLIKCDKPIDQWLYRITFNCNEINPNGQEIVVIVGSESLSIDGELYTTPDGVPFKSVVEFFTEKYNYFRSAQQKD